MGIKEKPANMTIVEKVNRAAGYYFKLYGREPNKCYVNPGLLQDGDPERVGLVELVAHAGVAPDHLWLGWQDRTDQF